MKIYYQIKENDYVEAGKLYRKPTRKFLVIVSLLLCTLTLIATTAPNPFSSLAGGGLIGLVVVYPVIYLLTPWLVARQYRKYSMLHGAQFTAEVCEDGIHFSSPNGNGATKWQHILQWRHNEHFILVYLSPRLYQPIPKQQDAAAFNEQLVNQLYQHVGNPK